ncbi:MAG: DUF2147 domain-containing protein [Myxococcota bacterium]|jgi:uncharacterized protein (DUF2147 family)
MKGMISVAAVLLFVGFSAFAADKAPDKVADKAPAPEVQLSPVGRWETIDDKKGKVTSVVEIVEKDGIMTGTIEKLVVEPGEDPTPKCDKCKGDLKDKPVVGMRILWDLKKDKKEKSEWSDGRILDPDNGETYRCYIGVQDGGKKLKVRGYLGIALFGRTQYWKKAE